MSQLKKINSALISVFYKDNLEPVIKKLNDAGAGMPNGRSYHVSHGDPNGLHVTDVWDSMEDFEAFGKTLVPIMHSLNIDPGQPEIAQVNNIIIG